MFTGIVESVGRVVELRLSNTNLDIRIASSVSRDLSTDQSVSHNGVCLTVIAVAENQHWVTAIHETLQKSNLGRLSVHDTVNLERCVKADGRYDGHIVQGHVDTMAKVVNIRDRHGSWVFRFALEKEGLMVEKGSICINGVSLTCFDIDKNEFSTAIIPYTFEHTNFDQLNVNDMVNIEFDMIGKYIHRLLTKRQNV